MQNNILTLGQKIRRIRRKMKLTQAEFGETFELAHSAISLIESDKRKPKSDFLRRLVLLGRVSPYYLLDIKKGDLNAE